eukprot:CAMPEP_0179158042 /NCGR_PEP_ID=MMETSP0796-20121207/77103_1 /TAXON_ID=73915 /ORGANISM="Pyrodinium bahamense, Strain pbaha01" /LENGTH=364 /DNA_ID=CAMNT_0020859695 /DNA_START=42 /DNA_END=1136 /DNA_ORIENTATION=-
MTSGDGPRRAPQQRQPLDTVIFLDVDGVLHSLYGDDLFKEQCVALLERIVRATDASIVLSSSWRIEAGKVAIINSILQKRNLPLIVDCTKDLSMPREAEICEWLDRHSGVARWIAIDDMDLQAKPTPQALRLQGHFVRTQSDEGLTQQDAELAIRLLVLQSQVPSMSRVASTASPKSCPASVACARARSPSLVRTPTPVQNEISCRAARQSRHQHTLAVTLSCDTLPRDKVSPAWRGSPRIDSRDIEATAVASFSFMPEACSQVSAASSRSFAPEVSTASMRSFAPEVSSTASRSFAPEVCRQPRQLRTCPVFAAPRLCDISPQVQFRQIRAQATCSWEAVPSSIPLAMATSVHRLWPLGSVSA